MSITDTNHRITGFAFRSDDLNTLYEVMIHGKSAQKYQNLGQHISALFEFDSEFGYFKVMANKIDAYIFPNVPIGVVTPLESDGFINYMGGFQTLLPSDRKEFVWVWIRDLVNQSQYKLITDQGSIALLNGPSAEGLKKPKTTLLADYKDVPFKDDILIGLISHETIRKIWLVTRPKTDLNNLVMYEAVVYDWNSRKINVLKMSDFRKVSIQFQLIKSY